MSWLCQGLNEAWKLPLFGFSQERVDNNQPKEVHLTSKEGLPTLGYPYEKASQVADQFTESLVDGTTPTGRLNS